MSVNRRVILKGMALSGVAGLGLSKAIPALAGQLSTTDSARPSAAQPLVVLSTGGAAQTLFLQGVNAAAGSSVQVQSLNLDPSVLSGFEYQLRATQPLRFVGLLDHAAATLVLDMARSAGARVPWIGQHSSTYEGTRHRLLSTESSHDCIRHLNHHLKTCHAFSHFNETSIASYLSTPSHRSGKTSEWLSELGYLLASRGRKPDMAALAPTAVMPLSGSFVSFLIET